MSKMRGILASISQQVSDGGDQYVEELEGSDPVFEGQERRTEKKQGVQQPILNGYHISGITVKIAEVISMRTFAWTINTFDCINGRNTLKSIRSTLKLRERVIGLKRELDSNYSISQG